ncbi:unnamed protein product [Symbiodinium microadriaticum]|nr:unnamed protein product [Symbiodinium microadriaticum]
MRFLLKYKVKDGQQKANARLILQGFRHIDVTSKKLETESPTLSKGARSLILLLCCQMGWKVFSADVKSAFLQSDDIDKDIRLFAVPNRDIRQRLARLMGLKDFQILRIKKPAFGDVRAPRQWYTTADRVNQDELFFARHKLDKCLYMSSRLAKGNDEPFRVFNLKGAAMVVDGVIGIHVDDLLGGGENVNTKEDTQGGGPEEVLCFRDRVQRLFQRFKFGHVDFSYDQTFCGVHLQQSFNHDAVMMNLKRYVHQVKPITVDKARKQMVTDTLDEREVGKLRSLLGALAWPATQCIPMLSASVSLMQASMSAPTVGDLLEANKTLRFAKEAVERYSWSIHRHGDLSTLCLAAYTDAAWAVRPDGSSQGGYIIFAASRDEVEAEKPFRLTALEWGSKKLTRVCRSSLAAETQAAATCVDELEWLKACWHLMLWPNADPTDDDMAKVTLSFVITDAKSLYDAANSMSAGLKLAERRSAIELSGTNERLKAIGGHWRWCNSNQQLADGLTKATARATCLEAFSRGVVSMKFDEAMTAAKKVSKESRQAELNELDNAAKELHEVNTAVAGMPLCRLPGCEKVVLNADQTGHRFHGLRAQGDGSLRDHRLLLLRHVPGDDNRCPHMVVVALDYEFEATDFELFHNYAADFELFFEYQAIDSDLFNVHKATDFELYNVHKATDFEHFDVFYGKYADRRLSDQPGGPDGAVQDERIRHVQHINELNERISELNRELAELRIPLPPDPDAVPRLQPLNPELPGHNPLMSADVFDIRAQIRGKATLAADFVGTQLGDIVEEMDPNDLGFPPVRRFKLWRGAHWASPALSWLRLSRSLEGSEGGRTRTSILDDPAFWGDEPLLPEPSKSEPSKKRKAPPLPLEEARSSAPAAKADRRPLFSAPRPLPEILRNAPAEEEVPPTRDPASGPATSSTAEDTANKVEIVKEEPEEEDPFDMCDSEIEDGSLQNLELPEDKCRTIKIEDGESTRQGKKPKSTRPSSKACLKRPQLPQFAFEIFKQECKAEDDDDQSSRGVKKELTLAKLVEKWKELKEEDMHHYIRLADEDRQRFEREYEEWRTQRATAGRKEESLKVLLDKRRATLENTLARFAGVVTTSTESKPKRPRRQVPKPPPGFPKQPVKSGYALFCSEQKAGVAARMSQSAEEAAAAVEGETAKPVADPPQAKPKGVASVLSAECPWVRSGYWDESNGERWLDLLHLSSGKGMTVATFDILDSMEIGEQDILDRDGQILCIQLASRLKPGILDVSAAALSELLSMEGMRLPKIATKSAKIRIEDRLKARDEANKKPNKDDSNEFDPADVDPACAAAEEMLAALDKEDEEAELTEATQAKEPQEPAEAETAEDRESRLRESRALMTKSSAVPDFLTSKYPSPAWGLIHHTISKDGSSPLFQAKLAGKAIFESKSLD